MLSWLSGIEFMQRTRDVVTDRQIGLQGVQSAGVAGSQLRAITGGRKFPA